VDKSRPRKDHFINDLRSHLDHLLKNSLRSDLDHIPILRYDTDPKYRNFDTDIVESPRDLPYGDIILHTLHTFKSGNGEGSGKQHKLGQCEGAQQQLTDLIRSKIMLLSIFRSSEVWI
jgi:hypothetical protein